MSAALHRATLKEEKNVDADTGFLLRHVKSDTERFSLHAHEFYEIFLTLIGKAEHIVNGVSFSVEPGQLIFVRDFDCHDYRRLEGRFEFLNLAFSRETFESMCSYLGEGFNDIAQSLVSDKYPPQIRLTDNEKQKLHMKLAELNSPGISDRRILKMKARKLLADVFADYFTKLSERVDGVPFWLENAYEKMKLPKNFIVGKQRFYELCGRSREHSSRSLVKYYGTTPTEMTNELRLGYAANLLLSSNLSATDICYECGFCNLSWFYNAFEEKFEMSPIEYRKNAESKK